MSVKRVREQSPCYRKTFASMHALLHAVQANPEDLDSVYRLQSKILKGLIRVEGSITSTRTKIASFRQALRIPRSGPDAKLCSIAIKEDIRALESTESEYARVRRLMLSFGDALAYMYIPSWNLKPLSSREDSGFIYGKSGLFAELKAFKKARKQCYVAFLNCLTSVLCHADITLLYGGENYDLLEVKTGTPRGRKYQSQITANEKIMAALNTPDIELPGNVRIPTSITLTRERQVTHVSSVTRLVQDSLSKGSSSKEVEEGQRFVAFSELSERSKRLFSGGHRRHYAIFLQASQFLPITSKPLCLSFVDFNIWYACAMGSAFLICLIDMSRIEELMNREEIDVRWLNDEDENFTLELSKNGFLIRVSTHQFLRLGTEFVSIKSFVDDLIEAVNQVSLPGSIFASKKIVEALQQLDVNDPFVEQHFRRH